MTETTKTINSIVIVGGGTSGWMTAAALANHAPLKHCKITLIESSKLGTIGVGEATIPTLRRFYQKLGLSDVEVLKATKGSCKLGIEFQGWAGENSRFIHPFGIYGQSTPTTPFHHYWLRAERAGAHSDLTDYSLGVQMAKHNKFVPPKIKPKNQLEIFDWALHFDASLFAKLMFDYSTNKGVQHIDNTIFSIENHLDGSISQLHFEDGSSIAADLFIDCSGFKALLIGENQAVEYENWSHWLLNDSAIAVQTSATTEPITRTLAIAKKGGWQWRIPLQHRVGNGYVYSSTYLSHEEAERSLLTSISGDIIQPPRKFSFTPGRRKTAWHNNCVAIGLSSGFLEPLESTSIALVETAIEKLLLTFNSNQYSINDVAKFNDVNAQEYERVRDFIILHYKLNGRSDSPMWQYYRDMAIPASLEEKMLTFAKTGELKRLPWEMFGPDSWLAIYHGLNFLPENYQASADNMPLNYLNAHLTKMREMVSSQVNNAPTHSEFLEKHCGYQPIKQQEAVCS
ncbi:tryptophan halogenase family protein [Pseudoalteromonas sp. MMG024]|uniref:tryptophan halogenase family protein n=1 Tax=Pseudoalteromonas sp. MMG024 TaxID=2909980 RepID=UPI001F4868E2|nr:tryptophan halogenase family protein [Pseudoalteromonas sp. MMG024]MCF6455749.1 tryptophan 7-halogenase [Pseudoalteromonas sp. MMG024]